MLENNHGLVGWMFFYGISNLVGLFYVKVSLTIIYLHYIGFFFISSVRSDFHMIDSLSINKLSIIWKSDLTDKMKRSFFQAAVVSILLYGCTTWMLTKQLEKKVDGNYTRMLRAILNKSWKQYPTKHRLYGHLPPITKTI